MINLKKIILVRYGEIALKGLNKPFFETELIRNIKKTLYGLGVISVSKSQSRIFIEPENDHAYDFNRALNLLSKIFGIVSVSPAYKIDSDFQNIIETTIMVVKEMMNPTHKTFKVHAKRGDKKFPLDSPQINMEIGGVILENFSQLNVDVHNPDFILYIEVREFTYIYSEIISAQGGMPIGTNGKAMLLLSGGIDSPVAGWMMAKRGVKLDAIHFYSYPYTSERSKEKVIDLAKILKTYCYNINLHIVPFTEIQLKLNDTCPKDLMTILMRRYMMTISETIALKNKCKALITGESLGQVASQTMESIAVTNSSVQIPVLRPLIGLDKTEVVDISRKIGTFETSILPYEDCCTVFVPKHPKTKPVLSEIIEIENKIDIKDLINYAINKIEIIKL